MKSLLISLQIKSLNPVIYNAVRAVVLVILLGGSVSAGIAQAELMIVLSDSIVPNSDLPEGHLDLWQPNSIYGYGESIDEGMISFIQRFMRYHGQWEKDTVFLSIERSEGVEWLEPIIHETAFVQIGELQIVLNNHLFQNVSFTGIESIDLIFSGERTFSYNSTMAQGAGIQVIEAVLATRPDMTLDEPRALVESHGFSETLDGVTTEIESNFAYFRFGGYQTWGLVAAEIDEQGYKLKHLFRNGHFIWVE